MWVKYVNLCLAVICMSGLVYCTSSCSQRRKCDAESLYLPMEQLSNYNVTGGSIDIVPLNGEAKLVAGKRGKALHLDGNTSMLVGDGRDTCLLDPYLCPNGMSMLMWVRVLAAKPNVQYIISNGGQHSFSRGYAILLQNGKLLAIVRKLTEVWQFTSAEIITTMEWFFLAFTWVDGDEVRVYRNGIPMNGSSYYTTQGLKIAFLDKFLLAAPNHLLPTDTSENANILLDELSFCDQWLDSAAMWNLYKDALVEHHSDDRHGTYYTLMLNATGITEDQAILSQVTDSVLSCLAFCNEINDCIGATYHHGAGQCRLFNISPAELVSAEYTAARSYIKSCP